MPYHSVWTQRRSPNGRRTLKSTARQVNRENQTTKGTEMQALTKTTKDIYRPVHVRGDKVPSLNRLTGESVTAEQGNRATT